MGTVAMICELVALTTSAGEKSSWTSIDPPPLIVPIAVSAAAAW